MITSLNQSAVNFGAYSSASPSPAQFGAKLPMQQPDQVMFSGEKKRGKGFKVGIVSLLAAAGLLAGCSSGGGTEAPTPPESPSVSAPAAPTTKPLDAESKAVQAQLDAYKKELSGDLKNLGTTKVLDKTTSGESTQTVFQIGDRLFVMSRLDNPNTEGVDTYILSKTQPGSTPNALMPESMLTYMANDEEAQSKSFTGDTDTHRASSPEVSAEVLKFIQDVDNRLG